MGGKKFKCLDSVYLINGAAFWRNACIWFLVCHTDKDLVRIINNFSPINLLKDDLFFSIETDG